MARIMSCVHCGDAVEVPEGYLQWDGHCACGRSVFDAVQDDEYDGVEAPEVGDMWTDDRGLGVITPNGHWYLTDEDALGLIAGLSALLQRRHEAQAADYLGQLTEMYDAQNDAPHAAWRISDGAAMGLITRVAGAIQQRARDPHRRNENAPASAATDDEDHEQFGDGSTRTPYPLEGEDVIIRDAEDLLEQLDEHHLQNACSQMRSKPFSEPGWDPPTP